jgi:hypothetical protein
MATAARVTLDEFIGAHRDELISRCKAKVARRSAVPATNGRDDDHGVPLFLDQLVGELRHGPSANKEISATAVKHGHDLLLKGFTISQVVHDYGDVCQSVTDLAMETHAPIAIEEFRTLNRCLDDAIAGAVTEHARGTQVVRDGQSGELRTLLHTAITGFEVLQTGTVGIGGTTGKLVSKSLAEMRAMMDRPIAKA